VTLVFSTEDLGFQPFIFDPADVAVFAAGGIQMHKSLHGI